MDASKLQNNKFYSTGKAVFNYVNVTYKEKEAIIYGIKLGVLVMENVTFELDLSKESFDNLNALDLGFKGY